MIQAVVNYYSETTNINNLENIMKLIHDSINIAETKDLETLKNQVKACIFIKLQEKDMDGFFGDMCRYASIIGQGGRFHTFNREFNGEQDWEIMKACLINAGNLDTLVNYKWAVYRENKGWRCVSGRETGIEYLWEFFAPEIRALMDYAERIIQKWHDRERLTRWEDDVRFSLMTRFEDWDQILAKAEELRNVK